MKQEAILAWLITEDQFANLIVSNCLLMVLLIAGSTLSLKQRNTGKRVYWANLPTPCIQFMLVITVNGILV